MNRKSYDNFDRETLSLENCDKEPVHIPGHIQGFATLIATDPKLKTITYCSDNGEETFGQSLDALLGHSIRTIFDTELLHALNNTLSLSSVHHQRERVGHYVNSDQWFDVWAHLHNDIPIVEFERIDKHQQEDIQSILTVRSLLARLQKIEQLDETLNDAVIGLQSFSGFDRVLIYQFDKNGDGEVKAEARSPAMDPLLGLRFPKWDIPNQARDIMRKLPLRVIADVDATPVMLRQADPTQAPLDLTVAACRGLSPIHNEYLRNMGVYGSMTLSIVVKDQLWGLIAFHHREARRIDPGLRGAAEVFAQFFSLQMEQRLERTRNKARTVALAHQNALMEAADSATNLSDLVNDIAGPFCRLLDAVGLAIVTPDNVVTHGLAPESKDIRLIGQALLKDSEKGVVSHESLAELVPNDHGFAGALVLSLHEEKTDYVVFFRQAAVISVQWAGAPEKEVVDAADGPRLKPRSSFLAYKQSMEHRCKPWEPDTLLSAKEIRTTLIRADTALFRRMAVKEERQRSIYIAELNHRVRNILALIRSLSRRAKESSNSLESYARTLEQRITALGAAHDLAANKVTTGVSIFAVLEAEVKPFSSGTQHPLVLSGESYVIRPDAAPIFALVIHELMTNCVKYGALSDPNGQVKIDVRKTGKNLRITWTETGGPSTSTPSRRGFGLGLIENAIPYELDGDSEVAFLAGGLKVTFWLPETIVEPMSEALSLDDYQSGQSDPKPDGIPETVLVVEDSMMIALDITDMLRSIKVTTVHTCATVRKALATLDATPPDFAILDVSLQNETSFEVAETLTTLGIPFCFATGYGSDVVLPTSLEDRKVLTKPLNSEALRSAINELYG